VSLLSSRRRLTPDRLRAVARSTARISHGRGAGVLLFCKQYIACASATSDLRAFAQREGAGVLSCWQEQGYRDGCRSYRHFGDGCACQAEWGRTQLPRSPDVLVSAGPEQPRHVRSHPSMIARHLSSASDLSQMDDASARGMQGTRLASRVGLSLNGIAAQVRRTACIDAGGRGVSTLMACYRGMR